MMASKIISFNQDPSSADKPSVTVKNDRAMVRPTKGYKQDVELYINQAKHADELVHFLTSEILEEYRITEEHAQFLVQEGQRIGIGGLRKLRRFYYDVLDFDLEYGTNTLEFISEETFRTHAKVEPDLFPEANISSVPYGVKHRSSLTSVIKNSFLHALRILREHGIQSDQVSVYDMGCGAAKPAMIASLSDFNFKNVVGVDYYKNVLSTARRNREIMIGELGDKQKFALVHADARTFQDFRGPTIVYLYNPFGKKIMKEVEKNLREVTEKCIVLYNKPLYQGLFSSHKGWYLERQTTNHDHDQELAIFSRGF